MVCAIESYLRLHTRLCEEELLIHSIRFYPIPVAIEVSSRVSRRVIPTSTYSVGRAKGDRAVRSPVCAYGSPGMLWFFFTMLEDIVMPMELTDTTNEWSCSWCRNRWCSLPLLLKDLILLMPRRDMPNPPDIMLPPLFPFPFPRRQISPLQRLLQPYNSIRRPG